MSTIYCSKGIRIALSSGALTMALLSFASPSLDAQVLYGTIVGNVKDTSQAAVPGATVTIISPKTNVTREAITNESGTYSVSNVIPGAYTVKVSLTGFKEFSQTDVQVSINNVTRVDATLDVGNISETVTVAATATPLQTDKTDVNKEISSKEITDLPLGQYRNYQSLLDLVPGVTPSAFQNAVADTPELALTTNVNGTARNSNNPDGSLLSSGNFMSITGARRDERQFRFGLRLSF